MTASNTGPAADSAAPSPQPSPDDIKRAASESMRAGVDIRAKIHDVTLLALRNRARTPGMEVVRAVTDGFALPSKAVRLRRAPEPSWMDQARPVRRKREAPRVRQLALTGKDLSDTEIKQALATMKKLEDDFGDGGSRGRGCQREDSTGAAADPGYRPPDRHGDRQDDGDQHDRTDPALFGRFPRCRTRRHGSRRRGRYAFRTTCGRNPGRDRRRAG